MMLENGYFLRIKYGYLLRNSYFVLQHDDSLEQGKSAHNPLGWVTLSTQMGMG
jgi:hypothetical protein